MDKPYQVVIGGSPQARGRWPSRRYASKSSAKRRMKQISAEHDLGVATIWILKD